MYPLGQGPDGAEVVKLLAKYLDALGLGLGVKVLGFGAEGFEFGVWGLGFGGL